MKTVRPLNAASRAALKKDFEAIPDRMRAKAREVCLESATEMVRQMQAVVPVVKGNLRNSIRVEDDSTESWIRYRVKVGGPLTTVAVRNSKKGNAPAYDYAKAEEYGTSDQPPRPFFRPTRDRVRKKHQAKMRNALKKAAQAG